MKKVFQNFAIPLIAIFSTLLAFLPWLKLLYSTPKGQIFSGIHWFTNDYFLYLSFVENGVRGQLAERFLINGLISYTAWVHGIYTISGYLLGHFARLDSITIYHIDRVVLGLIFLLVLGYFLMHILHSRYQVFLTFIYMFWISGFPTAFDIINKPTGRYLDWVQGLNILNRIATLPHYLLSFIFFIAAVWVYLDYKSSILKKIIYLIVFTTILTVANPINIVIFYTVLVLYLPLSLIINLWRGILKRKKIFPLEFAQVVTLDLTKDIFTTAVIFLVNLFPIVYFRLLLDSYPWGKIANVFGYYVGGAYIPLEELFLALGPVFIMTLVGIIIVLWNIVSGRKQNRWYTFFLSWFVVQGVLFLRANSLGLESHRFLQGLYYIPMAVLSVHTLQVIGVTLERLTRVSFLRIKAMGWEFIVTVLLFILTLPTLYVSYLQFFSSWGEHTFTLNYPLRSQYQAYKFLEHSTPFASSVLALGDASFHLPALSGNAVIIEDYGRRKYEKSQFFSNAIPDDEAYHYLKDNKVSYVLVGREERNWGFDPKNYSFLKSIFHNSDLEIYQVI